VASGPSRVLIADDEPQLLRVLVLALEKSGYSVVTANNGVEAISVFQAAPSEISAIVVDAAIGPHGAANVLTTIAKECPRLRVVITSGDQLSDSLRSVLLAHDGLFLRKPFPPSALLCALNDALIQEGD
jgi:two-component system cell cycle sensor histidine kinase/response regulator CckA